MGELERQAKAKRYRVQAEQLILGALTVAVLGGIAVTAPNAVQLLKYVPLPDTDARDPRRRVSEAVSRLRKNGLVEWQETKGRWRLQITEKGKRHFSRLNIYTPKKPRRWDGRWRFVMFDVSERKRTLRNHIRSLIGNYGFHQMQQSVWVYPYDCEEFVMLLKAELGTGNQLLYIVADAVEYDAPLRKHFGL